MVASISCEDDFMLCACTVEIADNDSSCLICFSLLMSSEVKVLLLYHIELDQFTVNSLT